MIDDIRLEELNKKEGARYLGYGNEVPDEIIMGIIRQCEEEILSAAKPRYIYKVFDITERQEGVAVEGTGLVLLGESIKQHLKGCSQAILLCATLSADMDKLIRITQVKDMTKAVVMDAFAGVAVEQLCDKIELSVKETFENKYFTYRFGIGYGDLPMEQLPEFLAVLNAGKTIGVTVTGGQMMSPTKSVACIIGISETEIKTKRKGCATCKMSGSCQFRVRGERCGF